MVGETHAFPLREMWVRASRLVTATEIDAVSAGKRVMQSGASPPCATPPDTGIRPSPPGPPPGRAPAPSGCVPDPRPQPSRHQVPQRRPQRPPDLRPGHEILHGQVPRSIAAHRRPCRSRRPPRPRQGRRPGPCTPTSGPLADPPHTLTRRIPRQSSDLTARPPCRSHYLRSGDTPSASPAR